MGRLCARGRSSAVVDPMTTLLAALTGTRYVYDTTYNNSALVTQGAGVATSLAEVNGGPAMPLTGSPVWDGVNKTISFNGTTQCGDTALDATLRLSGDWTLYVIAAFPASGQSVGVNDGSLSNYASFGNIGGTLTQSSAGTAGVNANAQTTDVNSATIRLAGLVHGGANWTHPISGSILGGRDGVTVNSEYSYLEQYGRGRVAQQSVQSFTTGSRRITIGANGDHSAFTAVTLKTLVWVDHELTYDEQRALRAFAATRSIVVTSTKNFVTFVGNSQMAGVIGTSFSTLLQSASVSPYTGLAAAIPTFGWDLYDDSQNGSREGQFIAHTRGASNRMRDLIGGALNPGRPKNLFIYYEGFNDYTLNSSLTTAQRAQIAIDMATRVYSAAKEAAYLVVAHTLVKASGSGVADPGTPFNIGADPAGALPAEARRYLYNNWIRANWQTFADALWDPAGNINFRHSDDTFATTSWGGSYGTLQTLYSTTANLPHQKTAGDVELCFAAGDSVYDSAYAAAYTAAWPGSPYPITGIAGPNKVGLWYVLHALGIV